MTEKNKTPFLLLATVADNVVEGGLRYTFRMQPNARAMATLTVGNMIEMAKSRGRPGQARGDHARGRQLRDHDG